MNSLARQVIQNLKMVATLLHSALAGFAVGLAALFSKETRDDYCDEKTNYQDGRRRDLR